MSSIPLSLSSDNGQIKGSAITEKERFFAVLSTLARLSVTSTDLHLLLNATLSTLLEQLPLSGCAVWLRAGEQDLLSPSASQLPKGASTCAIGEDNPLIQQVLITGHLLLKGEEAHALITLPNHTSIAVAPMRRGDTLLGLLGYIAHPTVLKSLTALIEASANVLSGPVLSAWLHRQQIESDDVTTMLMQFAGELREQQSLDTILVTLNTLALRVFNCDWSGVYRWHNDGFVPIQIMTRVGQQSLEYESVLTTQDYPLLEVLLNDPQLLFLHDLRDQPFALPIYLDRHALRGITFVPLQQNPNTPLGLLTLGYRGPLVPFSSRTSALAQGLARMVAVALERERTQEGKV